MLTLLVLFLLLVWAAVGGLAAAGIACAAQRARKTSSAVLTSSAWVQSMPCGAPSIST